LRKKNLCKKNCLVAKGVTEYFRGINMLLLRAFEESVRIMIPWE